MIRILAIDATHGQRGLGRNISSSGKRVAWILTGDLKKNWLVKV
jgi:hypothetical protein